MNELKLAYLDFSESGQPILALHGHFGRAASFAGMGLAFKPRWRVIAPDHRGHGWSDQTDDFSRDAYINDAAEFIRQLDLAPCVVYGHSLGGINAYQLAARHPELVRALIIEDIGAELNDDASAYLKWPRRFPSYQAAKDYLDREVFLSGYFIESLVEFEDGWGFRFDIERLVRSQQLLNGNWWSDWLASKCPALLLHGVRSSILRANQAQEMASRRPRTKLVSFDQCGHNIHDVDPENCFKAVREFLMFLPPGS